MRRFTFADSLTNNLIMLRMKRDEFGINVSPSVHAEAEINKPVRPVLTELNAKCRLERAVRICQMFRNS